MGPSAQGFSFEYNSVDYQLYNVYVRAARRPLLPKPKIQIESLGATDGAATSGQHWEGRGIFLDCAIVDTSSLEASITNVIAGLKASQTGEHDLIVDHFGTNAWDARLVTEIDASVFITGAEFGLEFFCSNPWSKDASTTTDGPQAISGDTTWTPTPSGSAISDPQWLINNTGDAAVAVTLINETTDQNIVWTNPLANGEWLKLDRDGQWTIAVSDDNGASYSPAFDNVTGTIPQMNGGVSNTIKVYGLTSGSIESNYTGRNNE